MNSFNRRISKCLFSASVLLAFSARADYATPFTDSTFAPADWSITPFNTGSGGTITGTQTLLSGQPAPSWSVSHHTNTGAFTVQGFHKSLVAPLNLANGAVTSIDFSIDARYVSGIALNGHQIGFAIEQGGVAYRASGSQTTGSSGQWVTRTGSFTAADFTRFDGAPGTPDFSTSGAPISFGFRTGNSGATGGHTQVVQYDNFRATSHRASVQISDGQWTPADWSHTDFSNDPGCSSVNSIYNFPASPELQVLHALNAPNATLQVFHKCLAPAATIHPAWGSVEAIDFSLSQLEFWGNTAGIALALEQDAITYRCVNAWIGAIEGGGWIGRRFTSNNASQFSRLDGQPGKPNFSIAGSPIRLGFVSRMNSSSDPLSVTERYDNFHVRVRFNACPCDIVLDGYVDDSDFVTFASAYDLLDCTDPSIPPDCPADVNKDGYVDDSDFVLFATAYDLLECP